MSIQPFTIDIPDVVVDDLRGRLARTRFLDDSPRRMHSGMTADYLRTLVDSWRAFDWRAGSLAEQASAVLCGRGRRNSALRPSAFGANWRARPPRDARMAHTFALQLDFADLLPDFDVVVVSLPGFAFSPPLDEPITEARFADLMHRLMTEVLGYERFLTYGEDLTANVSDLIAASHPDTVAGIVVTHAHFLGAAEREATTDADARAFYDRVDAEAYAMSGYAHLQHTRPDTLAAALHDSPARILAWIAEKLVEWSDTPVGDPSAVGRRISRDRILTEATLYWVTQSIGTSFRPYFDGGGGDVPPVEVPAAVFIQRHEHDNPESVARSFYRDLRVFERLEEGGHFAVAEVPAAMAERTRAFAREIGALA